jgi:3-(3-hydroxy-phenyl)propionate hydroxylase
MAFIRGAGEAHENRRKAMLALKADDDKRRAYLLRQAMFESLDAGARNRLRG